MKLLIPAFDSLATASFIPLLSKLGSTEDANLVFHCQGVYNEPKNRDQALDNLSKWCDAGNTVGPKLQARFNVHNTTAFVCSYRDEIHCNSSAVDRWVGGIKSYCPGDDQGGTVWDVDSDVTYGWSTVPRAICGDWIKVAYEDGTLDPLPNPKDIP